LSTEKSAPIIVEKSASPAKRLGHKRRIGRTVISERRILIIMVVEISISKNNGYVTAARIAQSCAEWPGAYMYA
jgi:hypothetical protein